MTAVESVLRQLHDRGAGLTLETRLAGGEFDTFLVRDGDGRRQVLKWLDGRDQRANAEAAVARVSRLRARGYPAPAHGPVIEIEDATVFLQEFVEGKTADTMGHGLLDRVLEVNTLQAGAGDGDGDGEELAWPAFMHKTLVEGLDLWSLHEPLKFLPTLRSGTRNGGISPAILVPEPGGGVRGAGDRASRSGRRWRAGRGAAGAARR